MTVALYQQGDAPFTQRTGGDDAAAILCSPDHDQSQCQGCDSTCVHVNVPVTVLTVLLQHAYHAHQEAYCTDVAELLLQQTYRQRQQRTSH